MAVSECCCLHESLEEEEESCEPMEDDSNTISDKMWPLAAVHFFHNIQSWRIRQKLEEFIFGLSGQATAEILLDEIGEEVDRDQDIGSVTYHTGFCEDKAGLPLFVFACSSEPEGLSDIPHYTQVASYDQVYLEPFWIHPLVEQEERRLRRMAIKCFNCGGDHHIKDCTEPKDIARICEERQSFRAKLGTFGADGRYHLSTSSQQHSKFCPGHISDKLRNALNLTPTDYPSYIRRMLIHGYPPGYKLLQQEDHLSLICDATSSECQDNVNTQRSHLEIIYPGFNDKSHTDTLGVEMKPVTIATNKAASLDEELGDITGYEFEEHETEGGEHVVGLKVKEEEDEDAPGDQHRNCFSVDFPPGRVHLDEESQVTPRQTLALIKNLISNKKSSNL